jgi:HEAT repeat protein
MHLALALLTSIVPAPLSPAAFEPLSPSFIHVQPPGNAGQSADGLTARARAILEKERQSKQPIARVYACELADLAEADPCLDVLRTVAADAGAPLQARTRAAALLSRRVNEAEAAKLFEFLATTAPVAELIPLAPVLGKAPGDAAAPVALRMLKAPGDPARIAAARVLGGIDRPDVRFALDSALNGAGPMLWSAITVARGRLGEPDALRILAGAQRHMEATDRVLAAAALTSSGDPRGNTLLALMARTQEGAPGLHAAELLLDADRQTAEKAIERALTVADPEVRSEALRLSRIAGMQVPSGADKMLADADPRVRIRAAELVVARDPGR